MILSVCTTTSVLGWETESPGVEICILDGEISPWGDYCPEGSLFWDGFTLSTFNLTIANLGNTSHRISKILLTQSILDECANPIFVVNISVTEDAKLPITLDQQEFWQYRVPENPQAHYYSTISICIDDEWSILQVDYWSSHEWPVSWTNLVPYGQEKSNDLISFGGELFPIFLIIVCLFGRRLFQTE